MSERQQYAALQNPYQAQRRIVGNHSESSVVAEHLQEDYLDFTTIKNLAQRRLFKEVFEFHYGEYVHLHGIYVEAIQKFRNYREQLLMLERNSESYKQMCDLIVKEYNDYNRTKSFRVNRKWFFQLHAVLSHIKQLIREYDERQLQEYLSRH